MSGSRRHPLAKAGLSLLLLAALVAALEGGLRLLGRAPPPLPSPFADDEALGAEGSGALPDRELFYRLRPDSQFLGYYRINALGYRGPPVAAARAPNTLRVVCTGDSSTFGLGVPEERAWPFVLQRLLDAAVGDVVSVEVIDAGVPGYTSLQNRVQVERDLLALRPDALVWLPTGHNDDARVAGRTDAEALLFRRSWSFTLSRTALGRALGFRADTATPADAGAAVDAPSAAAALRPRVPLADFEANLRAVAEACRAAGVPLALVVPPHDEAVRAHRPNEIAAEEVVRSVAHADRSHDANPDGLPCADPRDDFAALAPRPLFPDTIHPNADGQALIAWHVFAALAWDAHFPWPERRAGFVQAWILSHDNGWQGPDDLPPQLTDDAPPRFRDLLAAARAGVGEDATFRAHDPLTGEQRRAWNLGAELLRAGAAGPFADNAARIEALRAHVRPRDDLTLILFHSRASAAGTPPNEAIAVARAVSALDASLGAHPAPMDARVFEAQRLIDAGQGSEALALLDAVLELNPRCAEAFGVRGLALERAGRRDEALVAWEAGAAAEPDSATGLFLLGRAQLQRGDNAGAEASLRRTLLLDPAHKLARLGLVRALLRQARPDEAEQQLRALRRVGATGVADVTALQAEIDRLRASALRPDGMMRAMLRLAPLLLLAACAAPSADLVLRGGRILTMDSRQPEATALAVRDGELLVVGSEADVASLIGSRTQVIELGGRVACPGFFDAHLHLSGLATTRTQVDLVGTGSEAEVVRRAAERAAGAAPGEWVLGRGWDQNDWERKDFPTNAALSAAVPDRPVVLWRVDGHALLANAAALAAAGVTADTRDPPGGRLLRGAEGTPTGVLVDDAMDLLTSAVPAISPARLEQAVNATIRDLHARGITAVADPGVPLATAQLYGEMARAGGFDLRAHVMLEPSEPVVWHDTLGFPTPDLTGHGRVAVRGVKAYADGALGSRGAALLEPYTDDAGQSGLLLTTTARLRALTERCLRAGWQLGVHAIGDRGNRMVLDVYEAALRAVPPLSRAVPEPRLRIEHAQVVAPADLPRFGRLGVVASMQALHQTSDMPWAEARLGPERVKGAYAWRALLDGGARLCGGSDAPVEEPDPLLGFHANVTRRDAHEQPPAGWYPEQRMTRAEALSSITSWAAWACFADDRLGSLEAGKAADIVILSADPLSVPEAELLGLTVEMTVFDGRVVYERTPVWP